MNIKIFKYILQIGNIYKLILCFLILHHNSKYQFEKLKFFYIYKKLIIKYIYIYKILIIKLFNKFKSILMISHSRTELLFTSSSSLILSIADL